MIVITLDHTDDDYLSGRSFNLIWFNIQRPLRSLYAVEFPFSTANEFDPARDLRSNLYLDANPLEHLILWPSYYIRRNPTMPGKAAVPLQPPDC